VNFSKKNKSKVSFCEQRSLRRRMILFDLIRAGLQIVSIKIFCFHISQKKLKKLKIETYFICSWKSKKEKKTSLALTCYDFYYYFIKSHSEKIKYKIFINLVVRTHTQSLSTFRAELKKKKKGS
jgi:hypothetical protein